MERFVGLVNEVEEYYISVGNTSLECQNIYSKVWFPGATGRHGNSVSVQRQGDGGGGGVGPSKASDPSGSQKAFIVKLYSSGKTTRVTFCKRYPRTFDWHSILAISL